MPYEISNTFHFIFEDQSIDLLCFFGIGTVPIVLVLVVPCTKILRYEKHLIVVDQQWSVSRCAGHGIPPQLSSRWMSSDYSASV